MLQHYLVVAWLNLRRAPLVGAISIARLALELRTDLGRREIDARSSHER